jgi:hypothetical protein
MDRCRTETPPLVALPGQGGRMAACWLQEPGVPPPPELGLADPGLADPTAPARPATADQNSPPAAGGAVSAMGGAPPPAPVAATDGAPPPASVATTDGAPPPASVATAAATVAENLGARDD